MEYIWGNYVVTKCRKTRSDIRPIGGYCEVLKTECRGNKLYACKRRVMRNSVRRIRYEANWSGFDNFLNCMSQYFHFAENMK